MPCGLFSRSLNIALLRMDTEEEDMHGKAKPKPVEVREVVVL
jgi:hypothetical protein